ncbi:leucine-rich repeat extensin-like protein 5 isoform X2 [Mercurialis annua]|uniref:leucine-rich repeat extensin-like protein 5 isoform X2 n=1 Tax=Mercurialis annua TaxID=3986 RepID=UPI00215E434B|nr:leucine-rich repeat extensin-like protein 5 isoform X2 [Mercurialis annua]
MMTAEVDRASTLEPHKRKMSEANTSSGASTTGAKVSIFAAKSGFVIPKRNLLSSLVPRSKGVKKPEGSDANEEGTFQVVKKTKWGVDITQDAAVRKGRALAYETRVNQITHQLKSGESQDSKIADQHADPTLSSCTIDSNVKDLELLKLEWREIIGEILKLNPSYKPPPNYEPLLKVATVPIPVEDHPRCNVVGLIFGPGGETQKRLEKETGAKIQVRGTKANTGEKVAYEELTVHVSADTYEKVDGAVAVIELLVTSISENLITGNNMNILNQSQDAPTGEQGVGPSVGTLQPPQKEQILYPGLQFSAVLGQPPGHLPTLVHMQNSIHSNTLPVLSSPLNPTNMPSLLPVSGFNSVHQNTSLVPSRPQLQMPRNYFMPNSQPSSLLLHPLSNVPPGPRFPMGSSSGWPAAPIGVSGGKMAPPMVSFQPRFPQPGFLSSAPSSDMLPANIGSSGPSTANVRMNHPSGALRFPSLPPHQMGSSSMPTMGMTAATLPHASVNPTHGSMASVSRPTRLSGIIGSLHGHSGPGDFTFQPHHPPNLASQLAPRPHNQAAAQDTRFPRPPALPLSTFRLAPSSTPLHGMHSFPSTQISNQMDQRPRAPFTGSFLAPRFPAFSNASPAIPPARNFSPTPQLPNLGGSFLLRPANPLQGQKNYPAPTSLGNFMAPNQHSGKITSFASPPLGQQIYDPFSPTSVPVMPQQQGKVTTPATDPD